MFRPRGARPLDSIAPASGQEFALLPPDSATANFIKMVQRIAAKIVRTITTG
jgi:multidrug resistance efflux pump